MDEPDKTNKPWISNKPEARLSIATFRFLDRALVRPAWFSAMPDSDHGGRSDLQRIRDKNRGIQAGILDYWVCQGPPPIIRALELKRGKNGLTSHQQQTVATLTACGSPPVIAWSLREVHDGLLIAGFRFLDNWRTTLAHMEAQLEAWDREAALIRSGDVVKKRRVTKPHIRTKPGLSWIRP